jgi:divalent metal cation (Fe/Co/Zn/Cd) transporter
MMSTMSEAALDRQLFIRRGKRLEYFTMGWNGLEALAALIAANIAGSVSLLGFGIDSCIEVASALALLWRISVDADERSRERNERFALRIVGFCFLGLALYVAYQSAADLLRKQAPQRSIPGIVLACAALVVMPLLARAKKRVANELKSGAMEADARQADFCMYLSLILLFGLVLNAMFGWWWTDSGAALIMVPIIAKEGWDGIQGKACCDSC